MRSPSPTSAKKRSSSITVPGGILIACLYSIVFSGCIAQRGVDFGAYTGRAEDIPIIRVYNVAGNNFPTPKETILILPPLGDATSEYQQALQKELQEEFQKYFSARVVNISSSGKMAEYVTEQNLAPENGFLDFAEVTRLGQLMQTRYVAGVLIQELRPYPPQILSLYIAILDVKNGVLIAELDATFNAADQKVVIAMQDYLQRRRARPFDRNNLNTMLQSPTEFHRFVTAECSRALASEMAPPREVKLWP